MNIDELTEVTMKMAEESERQCRELVSILVTVAQLDANKLKSYLRSKND